MRILFWIGTFWPAIGGVTVQATQLLPALQKRGHEIIALAFASQDSADVPYEDQYQNIRIYRIPFWKSHNDVEEMIRIRQQVDQLRRSFAPDLIHKNGVGAGDFFLTTNLGPPLPLVVVLHEECPKRVESVARQTLNNADWVVGVSNFILVRARQLVPEVIPRSSVIHNAVSEPSVQPEALPVEKPRLLCLGRLVREKGFDLALIAIASIVSRFPGLKVVISGEGPERANLERQATDFGIDKFVEFTGWISPEEVPALINTSTAVLMPSRWQEPFGLVALEAALMARPVIAAKVGGVPEIVLHQQTGMLVDPDNSGALAEAIASLLRDPKTAERMGWNARRLALENFCFQKHVDNYEVIYHRVVTNCRIRTERKSLGYSEPLQ